MSKRLHRKNRLFEKQDGLCYYCQRPLDPPNMQTGQPSMATIDHVVPTSRGGSYGEKVLACYACNLAKGNKSAQDFFELLDVSKKS